MANFSSQFLDFLKAYDSDAWHDAKKMAPDDPKAAAALEARKSEIFAKYKDMEAIWENVPQSIRDRYPGVPLPRDIMEAAARGEIETLRAMEYDASLKTAEDAREKVQKHREEVQKAVEAAASSWADVTTKAALGVAVTAAIAGYAMETCHILASNRELRDAMLANAPDGKLSPKEHALRIKLRGKDLEAMKRDHRKHRPERALLRLLHEYNRGDDIPNFARDLAELIKKIETNGRQGELLEMLKNPRVQNKLSLFKPETLDILKKNVLPYIPEKERGEIMENILAHSKQRKNEVQATKGAPEKNTNSRPPVRGRQAQNVRSN